jgi:hypothetical protein
VSKLSVHRLESDIISNGHEDFSLRMPCVVEDSAVPFLPNSPVHQDSHRIEITPVRLGCMLPGTKPPVCGVDETSSRNREVCCCPKASLLPHGSGERAVDEEVLAGFRLPQATVRPASTLQVIRRQAPFRLNLTECVLA